MDIYFDFEATQFKENIIAIGATCTYGSFDCLVCPPRGDKITSFITNLTGITKEMAKTALSADDAFSDLYYWLFNMSKCAIENNDFSPVFYHAYGNMDKVFLLKTAQHMQSSTMKNFVEKLAESIIDDSSKACHFFHTKAIGVYRGLRFFEEDLAEQDHDPLNDAIALKKLMKHISNSDPLEKCPFEENKPQQQNTSQTKSESHKVIAINVQNKQKKEFRCFNDAFNWALAKVRKSNPDATKKTVKKHLKVAIISNGNYINWNWKRKD